ncbi:hypothetical protein C7B61_12865 [filamentous cyanobacterium CCP1]|nr:hypothetical protein C7B76_09230 [filamentous cyanobacterium CCP2]PSB63850.1 hypothetical protein C7B61_12865 [filamentous cyanobacterium CCP1]
MTIPESPIALLEQEVEALVDEHKGLKKLNQRIGLSLGISGIVFSFLATVAGIVGTADAAKVAAGFAAASSALQGALFAYPVEKRSSFYRILEAKGKNLASNLKFQQSSQTADQYLEKLLEQLKALRLEAAIEPDSDQQQERSGSDAVSSDSELPPEQDNQSITNESFAA